MTLVPRGHMSRSRAPFCDAEPQMRRVEGARSSLATPMTQGTLNWGCGVSKPHRPTAFHGGLTRVCGYKTLDSRDSGNLVAVEATCICVHMCVCVLLCARVCACAIGHRAHKQADCCGSPNPCPFTPVTPKGWPGLRDRHLGGREGGLWTTQPGAQ